MSRKSRLSIVPGRVWTDDRFTGADFRVLGLLGAHIDDNGWCTRSQTRMARQLGIGRATVYDSLQRLRAIGVVQQRPNLTDDGRDCSHDYRVLLDVEPDDLSPDPFLTVAEGGAAGASASPAGQPAPPAVPEPAPYKNDPSRTSPSSARGFEPPDAFEQF